MIKKSFLDRNPTWPAPHQRSSRRSSASCSGSSLGLENPVHKLSIHCILSDIRLWVGDPSTSSCLVFLPLSQPIQSLSNPFLGMIYKTRLENPFLDYKTRSLIEVPRDPPHIRGRPAAVSRSNRCVCIDGKYSIGPSIRPICTRC